jgi:hypothetical protein
VQYLLVLQIILAWIPASSLPAKAGGGGWEDDKREHYS